MSTDKSVKSDRTDNSINDGSNYTGKSSVIRKKQ